LVLFFVISTFLNTDVVNITETYIKQVVSNVVPAVQGLRRYRPSAWFAAWLHLWQKV